MCDVMERYMADEVKEIKEQYDAVIAKKHEKLAAQQAAYDASIAAKDSQIADLMKQLLESQQKRRNA